MDLNFVRQNYICLEQIMQPMPDGGGLRQQVITDHIAQEFLCFEVQQFFLWTIDRCLIKSHESCKCVLIPMTHFALDMEKIKIGLD